MSYRSGSIPLDAFFSASVKTGLLGSIVIAGTIAPWWLSLSSAELSPGFIGSTLFLLAFLLFVGTGGTALCLAIFGLPIANLASDLIAKSGGAFVAIASAIIVAVALSALLIGTEAILFVLAYAIPAGFFFQREILLYRDIEG